MFDEEMKAAVGAEFISLMGLIALEDLLMCNQIKTINP